jgi:hypothetical protein
LIQDPIDLKLELGMARTQPTLMNNFSSYPILAFEHPTIMSRAKKI